VTWRSEEQNQTSIGSYRKRTDPHERRSVIVGLSGVPGAEQGIFARRNLFIGDVISYLGGLKTYRRNFLFGNMTQSEREDAGAMFYNFGNNAPPRWQVPPNMVIDIPDPYRNTAEYRTTFGHKVNHKFCSFGECNSRFRMVIHPFMGKLVCVVATEDIQKGEEIFVDYTMRLGYRSPAWFQEEYRAAKDRFTQRQNKESKVNK